MKLVLVIVLFLLSFFSTEATIPVLTNATVDVKELTILGIDLTFASYNLYFDQDLYFFKSGLCTAYNCTTGHVIHGDQNPCVCDYTNTTNSCGVGSLLNGAGSCVCSQSQTLCDKSFSPWIDIDVRGLDSSMSFPTKKLPQGGVQHYRLFSNQTCFAFHTYLRMKYGSTSFLMSNTGIATNENSAWSMTSLKQKQEFLVCPSNQDYIQGTYFLSVAAFSDSEYELVIEPQFVPSLDVTVDTTTCKAVNFTQPWLTIGTCLYDGVPQTASCPGRNGISEGVGVHYFNVTFENGECSPVHLTVDGYGSGIEIGLMAGYVDEAPGRSPKFNGTWNAVSSDRQVSTILCPRNNEPYALIWVGVHCWVRGSDYSNYTVYATTNHFDHWSRTRLADTALFDANYDLLGMAEVIFPQPIAGQGALSTCTDRTRTCQEMSFALASENPNPFFPVPPVLLNLDGVEDLFSSITGNYTLPLPFVPIPNAISIIVLLSYQTNSVVTILDEKDADKVLIRLLGHVGSVTGETIWANYTASFKTPTCKYSEFDKSVNIINSIIEELSETDSTSELNTIRYKLDSATFMDGYISCKDFVDNLTSIVSAVNVTEMDFACNVSQYHPSWSSNPCCNPKASWTYTCYPSNVTVSLIDFSVQENSVNQVCKHVECSQSYLEDYALAKGSFQSGQCSTKTDISLEVSAVQKKYRQCKEDAYEIPNCYSDSECSYANQNFTCNIFTHECLIPYQLQEKSFLSCLAGQLTKSQEAFLQDKYGIVVSASDSSFVDKWYQGVTVQDCVALYGSSVNLQHRSKTVTSASDLECATPQNCPSYYCEDTTCPFEEVTCFPVCSGASQTYRTSSPGECESDVVCNWNSTLCENETPGQCESLCETPATPFCGLCENSQCVEFSQITSAASCASTTVCALHNGSYVFNITDSECQNLAECDASCGKSCQASNPLYADGICYSYPANSSVCSSLGGTWTNNTGTKSNTTAPWVCVFSGQTESSCLLIAGAVFDKCSSLSTYDCTQCHNGRCTAFGQNLMSCMVTQNTCANEMACTNSGKCSDAEFLDLPAYYGACKQSRYPAVDGVSDYPFCIPGFTTIPNACLNYSATYQESCVFGTWQFPASDEASCVAQKGCLDSAEGQPRFSPKSQTDCTSEYTQGSWESYWSWTPGRWVGGVQRSLTWNSRQSQSKYQWSNTSSFFQIENDFFGSASHILALQSKSAALCQFERILNPMQSVVCDCTNSGSSNCFDTSVETSIAQIQVCENTPSNATYPDIMLTTFNDSASYFCVDVLVSEISAKNYQSQESQRLLANFVPLTDIKTPEFSVFNSHDAVIGAIVSNGVGIKTLGDANLRSIEVCLRKSIGHSGFNFPVPDFGAEKDGKIVPLNMAVSTKTVFNSAYGGDYICAIITNVTSEREFFAIERKATYADEEEAILTPTAEVLTYILAALFLVASAVVSVQLMLYGFSWYLGNLPILLEHFLVLFIWLFLCFRAIYFFLITKGFDSQLGDYALVALPTFFYFTAFTIIVVLWAVVACKRFTNDVKKFQRMIHRSVIGINVVLYATFAALILAFQFGATSEESPCGSRQEDTSNTEQIRQRVSIAYGLIISVTSFIIGVLFIIFGFRIKTFISASESTEKIFIVTAVCSVCFILHCGFILAVSFMSKPHLYFSFFGLIITEWLPAMFIIVWLFMRRRAQLLSGSRSSNSTSVKVKSISGRSTSDRKSAKSSEVELKSIEM